MNFLDLPMLFECEGEELLGIVSKPETLESPDGLLVIVGGPQYRVGSHRQFVSLVRSLAQRGLACMRFDYRGMGDATGEQRGFDRIDEDIRAAIDVFLGAVPGLKRVVLWGLCDGASAACFYAPRDPRVAGVILLNPWVRTAQGEAQTMLRHYYVSRLLDPSFWKKLLSGGVSLGRSLRALARVAGDAGSTAGGSADDLPLRMARQLADSRRPFALALSGRDYVAKEFEQLLEAGTPWAELTAGDRCAGLERFIDADHTFSTAAWREAVAEASYRWMGSLGKP